MNTSSAMNGTELKTRESLIERIKDQEDKDSWREFFNTYWKLIYGFAMKSGLTEAEEVVQETMITISKSLNDYRYDPQKCSFKGWICHKAKWRIVDQIRKRNPNFVQRAKGREDHPSRTATVERVPDEKSLRLDQLWEEEWKANLWEVAVERIRQQASEREFQIFELYVLREWPVAKVKRVLKVSTTQVYVSKYRVSNLIKKEIKKLENEMG